MNQNFDEMEPEAGRYQKMYSSEDPRVQAIWDNAVFDESSGRWITSCGCGYCCWTDSRAFQEDDEMYFEDLKAEHPDIPLRESHIDLEYDGEGIGYAWFFLEEHNGRRKHRMLSFSLNNISFDQGSEWEAAVARWHKTGDIQAPNMSLKFGQLP